MNEISELERRITYALERIGRGMERLPEAKPPADTTAADLEVARLRAALEGERAANAQLAERLRALKERGGGAGTEADRRIEAMTRQLDVQGLEMQRLRKATIQLREQLRAMREAAAQGVADPHLINKAMLAELEGMRAARASEAAELEEILAELAPHLPAQPAGAEVKTDA